MSSPQSDHCLSTPALLFDSSHQLPILGSSSAGESAPETTTSNASNVVTEVVVHPLVLLHILDHHSRRQESSGRVIGTLLGKKDGNHVEITNCFAVPHAERGDEVAIGKDYNKQMLNLFLRCNPKESIVGWYASVTDRADDKTKNAKNAVEDYIADTSSLIHEFYSGETGDSAAVNSGGAVSAAAEDALQFQSNMEPIHLVVDTRLVYDHVSIRAYRNTPVIVQGEPLANLFHELKVTLVANEPETICLNNMIKHQNSQQKTTTEEPTTGEEEEKKADDSEGGAGILPIIVSMEKLHTLLDNTLEYVNKVIEQQEKNGGNAVNNIDPEMGRSISDTLASIPRMRPDIFDKLFHDSLQDLLMVTYLSNITRTQLTIAEKLNATLGV